MNSPLHSPYSDVAEDFREAMSGLRANNKWEIENLTVIARENTESANAISRVIESHIKTPAALSAPMMHVLERSLTCFGAAGQPIDKVDSMLMLSMITHASSLNTLILSQTAPPYKLPALYVLDSIVKNVGSPYNIILGRNLFSIFMEAYSRVDDQTRSQMQSMLKTWMQPIPGSLDPKPVFPNNTTSVIDNALKASRANEFARQQRQTHGLPARPPVGGPSYPPSWGTPANGTPFSPPPNVYAFNGYPQNGYAQYHGYLQQHQTPQPPFLPPSPGQMLPQRPADYGKLYKDVEDLIGSIHRKLAVSPADQSLNARLKAMLELKTLIQTTFPAPNEWDRIRSQLALLVQQENSPPYNAPPYTHATPTPTQNQQAGMMSGPLQPELPKPSAHSSSQPSLAQLLAGLPEQRAPTPQNSQQPAALPAHLSNEVSTGSAPSSAHADTGNIMEMLRNSGVLSTPAPASRPTSTQPTNSAFPPPKAPSDMMGQMTSGSTAQPPTDLVALLASLSQPNGSGSSVQQGPVVELTSASIKTARPDMINDRLYKASPSQCMTCGRRFAATAQGKARKARHLDYHFRTNQRVAESEGNGRRGVCRAWYPNEHEWIRHREIDDADENAVDREKVAQTQSTDGDGDSHGVGGADGERARDSIRFVLVPDAGAIQASEKAGQPVNLCPICQEKFENRWHDGVQEWVWMDAVKAGPHGRVYHASCYDEIRRDQEKAQKRRVEEAVPAVVGRKRKMEEEVGTPPTKSPRQDV
ncbi:MAG: hypothetical protein Q9159_003298 [Coniocarpon cinnabarinum]